MLYSEIHNLRQNEHCDIILNAGNKEIPAHRLMLAATIPYFQLMFQDCFEENSKHTIAIQGIDSEVLKNLVSLSYGAEIEVELANLNRYLLGADFLLLKNVKECIFKNFVIENYTKFIEFQDFLELKSAELIPIIQCDRLNVACEEIVYHSVMKWVKYAASDRVPLLPEVLSNVRLCYLHREFLYDIVRNESLIKNSEECEKLFQEAIAFLMICKVRQSTITHGPRKNYM